MRLAKSTSPHRRRAPPEPGRKRGLFGREKGRRRTNVDGTRLASRSNFSLCPGPEARGGGGKKTVVPEGKKKRGEGEKRPAASNPFFLLYAATTGRQGERKKKGHATRKRGEAERFVERRRPVDSPSLRVLREGRGEKKDSARGKKKKGGRKNQVRRLCSSLSAIRRGFAARARWG